MIPDESDRMMRLGLGLSDAAVRCTITDSASHRRTSHKNSTLGTRAPRLLSHVSGHLWPLFRQADVKIFPIPRDEKRVMIRSIVKDVIVYNEVIVYKDDCKNQASSSSSSPNERSDRCFANVLPCSVPVPVSRGETRANF